MALFQGTTLRGLLLDSYAFGTVGRSPASRRLSASSAPGSCCSSPALALPTHGGSAVRTRQYARPRSACPAKPTSSRRPVYNQIHQIDTRFGIKRNLLLLDNNILNSHDLDRIVQDVKKAGFIKKPNFVEPSPFLTFTRRVKENINSDKNYDAALNFLRSFRTRIKKQEVLIQFNSLIDEIEKSHTPKRSLHARMDKLLPIIDIYKNKTLKQRHVDFNQGIDARLLTEDRLKIICELPISPLRIAFDSISETKIYTRAVHLAHKFGFRELSNYMLYNHNDKPEDLWQRLRINADLRDELGVNIYSFPMKYIPVFEIDREYLGKHWNKKYIRAIQAILLVKKRHRFNKSQFF